MEWLTVTEVSEKLGIPSETIRRYISRHGINLYVRKGHKSYQIGEISLDTINQIRGLYGEGKQADEIDDILSRGNTTSIIEISEDKLNTDKDMVSAVRDLDSKLDAIANMLVNIDERLKQHEDFRSEVKGELSELHSQLEDINIEVAAAGDTLEKNLEIFRAETNDKFEQVLSRVETYKKPKNWVSRLFKS